jgi:hypothetical protein
MVQVFPGPMHLFCMLYEAKVVKHEIFQDRTPSDSPLPTISTSDHKGLPKGFLRHNAA